MTLVKETWLNMLFHPLLTLLLRATGVLLLTWIFWWTALDLFFPELSLLAILLPLYVVLPPLLFSLVGKFLPFLVPPALVSVLIVCVLAWFHRRRGGRFAVWHTLLANALFLPLFLLAADAYRAILMHQDIARYSPDCVLYMEHFWSALSRGTGSYGHHAEFLKNGNSYKWSYAERQFVPENVSGTRVCPKSSGG